MRGRGSLFFMGFFDSEAHSVLACATECDARHGRPQGGLIASQNDAPIPIMSNISFIWNRHANAHRTH